MLEKINKTVEEWIILGEIALKDSTDKKIEIVKEKTKKIQKMNEQVVDYQIEVKDQMRALFQNLLKSVMLIAKESNIIDATVPKMNSSFKQLYVDLDLQKNIISGDVSKEISAKMAALRSSLEKLKSCQSEVEFTLETFLQFLKNSSNSI